MSTIEQVQQLVSEINRLHHEFSKKYFELDKIEKINLYNELKI